MKHLRLFPNKESYVTEKDNLTLPNVSAVWDKYLGSGGVFYHQNSKPKEDNAVVLATYDAVDDGEYGMQCYNVRSNIKSIKVDGVDPFEGIVEDEVEHNNTYELNNSNIVINWDEWTADCPDEVMFNGKVNSLTLKPKDDSIVLSPEAFKSGEISFGFVYLGEGDNTKYIDGWAISDDEWNFDASSNSISINDDGINGDWYSYRDYAIFLVKYTDDMDYPEIIDTISVVNYTTGGIPVQYSFENEGIHEVEIVFKDNSIGFSTFEYCSSLTSITIPNDVTDIGDNAFYGCWNLPVIDGIQYADTYLIEVVDTSLSEYTIKDNTRFIGNYAFSSCSNLTSITIPNSVTSIGNYAFYGCSSITSINIPNSVTSIENNAFYQCSTLQSVIIGNGVTEIGRDAFNGCTGKLVVNCNIPSVSYYEKGAFYNSEFTSIIIGDSVTSIGDYAFWGCGSLTSITIPNSVTSIGKCAFENCSSLTDITIPESVTSIGQWAFCSCSNLTSVYCKPVTPPTIGTDIFDYYTNRKIYVPTKSVDVYKSTNGWNDYVDYIVGTKSFNFNVVCEYNITDISEETCIAGSYSGNCFKSMIVDGVKMDLYSYYQFDTTGLHTVEFVLDNENLRGYTFDGCSNLISVTIPDSVTSIENNAFYNCSNLKSFKGKFASEDGRCLIIDGTIKALAPAGLTEYTIPNNVTTIEDYVFSGCTSLTDITIPDSVTSIGKSAFSGCTSLTDITIPDSVTTIEDYVFSGCTSLTDITIPDSVTSIGDSAFYGCFSLKDITIPNSVTSIGEFAFQNCTSLTDITIPDNVTSIGNSAFNNCSSLTSVTIGSGVTSIAGSTFYGCSNLTSITIPDSVTSIEYGAFSNCSGLTSITIPDNVTSIGNSAFYGCSNLMRFNGKFASEDGRCLIIDGTLDSFAPAGLTEYIIPDSVTTIGSYAFSDCSSLTSVTIPDSVTSIGDSAFKYCSSLTSVTIPDSVTSIGSYAFNNCTSLTNLTIGDSVTSIGRYAFVGCTGELVVNCNIPSVSSASNGLFSSSKFTKITIGDSVTSIGRYAFCECSSLTSVTIGDSVTSIEDRAFCECSSLTSVTIGNSVTSIGDSAFKYCSSLTSVYSKAITPPYGGYNMFNSNAFDRKIYVPMESVNAYKSANHWSDYADAIEGYNFN